jgi:hypothetical protein
MAVIPSSGSRDAMGMQRPTGCVSDPEIRAIRPRLGAAERASQGVVLLALRPNNDVVSGLRWS